MVLRSPLGWDPVVYRARRPWLPWTVLASVLTVALIAGTWIRLPYYAIEPGSAREVGDLIAIDGIEVFPPDGELLLTTINLSPVSALEAVTGWIRDDVDVVPEEQVLPPDVSDEDFVRFNVMEMDDSKHTAVVVALRRLGYQVAEQGEGALVERVLPQFPASGRIEPGDVIVSVDGNPVRLMQEAVALIGQHQPGESVRLEVKSVAGGALKTIDVPLAADPDQGGKPVLGVILRTSQRRFDLPFPVEIQSDRIGGPSAGLAFTLGVIDRLTAGELTGGLKVAVTGTIEIDGRVGDVGGVAQKTAAVNRSDADVFLVPAAKFEVAKARADDDLIVMKVSTLQEALDALASVGGDLAGLSAAASPPSGR